MTRNIKPKNKPDIKQDIMTQIRTGKLSMKARWIYVAQKIGLKSGLALTVLVSVFLVNLFLFYIKTNNLLPTLHMGTAPYQLFLHNFPYLLFFLILISFTILNYLLKKTDLFYKMPSYVTAGLIIILLLLSVMLLFCCGFNDHMQLNQGYHIPIVSHFYMEHCPFHLN